MSSAASRAAKTLSGSSRNRPSRSMSHRSSGSGSGNFSSSFNSGDVSGEHTSGGPSFMDDVQAQYESLSDKLAREASLGSTAPETVTGDTTISGKSKLKSSLKSKMKAKRVKWAETAAIASTMDGDNADEYDDEEYVPRSPLDILSDLFAKKYTLPIFLVMSAGIFLMVHLAGGPSDASFRRYGDDSGYGGGGNQPSALSRGYSYLVGSNRQRNVGGGDGFGDIIFSLSPTSSGGLDSSSGQPTTSVMFHLTPKISPNSDGTPASADGYEPGWVLVPTKTDAWATSDADDNSPTTLKWDLQQGVPPGASPDDGSPTSLAWSFEGRESGEDDGSPTTLKWNYPPGVPTPDPALLIEIAPLDDNSPTTLKWGGFVTPPKPALSPTFLSNPDAGSPTTLKWNFPLGTPTPDPILLKAVPDALVWGYPPGVPTPDPALLTDSESVATLEWGYPPGVPTPDPALLTNSESVALPLGWGFPEGVPTPDPLLLNGFMSGTEAPTKRNVETGMIVTTQKPTPYPTKAVTDSPVPALLKIADMTPETPRPTNPPLPPPPAPAQPKIARPPRLPAAPRPPRPPSPKVNNRPYSGPGGWQGWGGGHGYDLGRHPGDQPGQYPGYQGVIPQGFVPMQSGCGCCCCSCGGMVGGYAGGGMMPQMTLQGGVVGQGGAVGQYGGGLVGQQGGVLNQGGPMVQGPGGAMIPAGSLQGYGSGSMAPTVTPGCPFDCLINESVPTMGRSNEDDALYEIFYTNPLNCCGTIVEIGVGDGMQHSTSYFFQKGMNWTTFLTEADPDEYDKIDGNRKDDKMKAINGAFCKDGPQLHFDMASRTFKSQASGDYTSELEGEFDVAGKPTVDCIRLDDILQGIDHVNVMVIRVKGDPWAVLRTMDWDVRVDIWLILMDERSDRLHATMRSALKLHNYVPAAWDIKLWCDTPTDCMPNEVWLRKGFNPIHNPMLMDHRGLLRGSTNEHLLI